MCIRDSLVYRVLVARAQAPGAVTATVVAAARELSLGTVLKDSDLKMSPWSGAVPKGVVTKKEAVVGRGVIAAIYEGEAIMDSRLAAPGGGGGLAPTISF